MYTTDETGEENESYSVLILKPSIYELFPWNLEYRNVAICVHIRFCRKPTKQNIINVK